MRICLMCRMPFEPKANAHKYCGYKNEPNTCAGIRYLDVRMSKEYKQRAKIVNRIYRENKAKKLKYEKDITKLKMLVEAYPNETKQLIELL